MGFFAVIPARGGSKGIKRKNLRKIMGQSLTARAVLVARAINEICFILLSTDSPEIASEGLLHGAQVPFLRPAELSRDDTPMVSVLKHALDWFREKKPEDAQRCEGLIVLQPTSPMRSVALVKNAIKIFRKHKNEGNPVDCLHCVSPVPDIFRPDRIFRRSDDGILQRFENNVSNESIVYRNGAAVILDMEKIEAITVNSRTVGIVTNERLVSIDSWEDLTKADILMCRNKPVENP